MEFRELKEVIDYYAKNICKDYNLTINSFWIGVFGEHTAFDQISFLVRINGGELNIKVPKTDLLGPESVIGGMLSRINYQLRRWIEDLRKEQLILRLAGVE
jgi:hypothetical protein